MSDLVIIPPGESTSLSPGSSAFAHGFGLFETMHFADGKLYFWNDHWARISKSAKHFALVLPKEDSVLAALRKLVVEANLEEATLKLSLVKDVEGSRLYIYPRPPLPTPDGRSLVLDTSCPIFERSIMAGHKTHNYMEAMHLLGLARAQGYYDTLRVDSLGNLAETTTANVFFVVGGQLYTPSLETGILPGVTRAALLRSADLNIEEGAFAPEKLLNAEAVFLTNAANGVVRIDAISGFSEAQTVDLSGKSYEWAPIEGEFARIRDERCLTLI